MDVKYRIENKIEFIYSNKCLFTIEINPLRFGGMGLSDTIYHAVGVNPYTYFFEDKPFDWKKAWGHSTDSFAWVLGYKGKKAKAGMLLPDHQKFINQLGTGVIKYYTIPDDPDVFAFAYIKKTDLAEFQPILDITFD